MRARGVLRSRCSTGAGRGSPNARSPNARKGHVHDFSAYDLDLEAFVKDIVLPDCPPPLYALGHSMGAAVLIRAAHQGRRWFDRIVLSGPMIDLAGRRGIALRARERTGHAADAGWAHPTCPAAAAPRSARCPFPAINLTSDRCVTRARSRSSRPSRRSASARRRSAGSMLRSGRCANSPIRLTRAACASRCCWSRPGRTRSSRRPAIGQFAVRLRAGSHLVIPGARHEILMEQDRYREQFWAAFDAFVPGTPMF